MKLRKLSEEEFDFTELDGMLKAMESFLDDASNDISIDEIVALQNSDGSFRLLDPDGIPNEAVIDFINTPSYLASSILIKEYLAGNTAIKDQLERGLHFTYGTGFRGHGYEEEKTRINSLKIFIRGGLPQFLEEKRDICPEFHCLVHNILHDYNYRLYHKDTMGFWGEDYAEDWQILVKKLKPLNRLYIAYGSNMNKEQMHTRCQDAKVCGSGYLPSWRLTMPFYANIEEDNDSKVPVLVWEISEADERALDYFEGYPSDYKKVELLVELDGKQLNAMAYIMTDWYKGQERKARIGYEETIKEGYLEAGFSLEEYKPRY